PLPPARAIARTPPQRLGVRAKPRTRRTGKRVFSRAVESPLMRTGSAVQAQIAPPPPRKERAVRSVAQDNDEVFMTAPQSCPAAPCPHSDTAPMGGPPLSPASRALCRPEPSYRIPPCPSPAARCSRRLPPRIVPCAHRAVQFASADPSSSTPPTPPTWLESTA